VLRYILLFLLAVFVLRALWRLLRGFIEGFSQPPRGTRVPQRGVQMMRDPVCGTFVVPDRAVMLTEGSQRLFFCSDACRDTYRNRSPAHGRTA
jgi:uncharacterized protein